MSFTVGSLFDGSGGFPLAGFMCGGVPVWASEIEPYPIAVTKTRFPYMKHLGSVTDVRGDVVDPVDVITFGSPCQDLSVAGKRAGLKHTENGDEETTRSGLFMEAVRIIKEMREKTNGVYPRIALWENVPGAFSSNKGEDFRVVLEELIKIVEPSTTMPPVPKNGWAYADYYCGDGWSIAYRVFDAQYWGVPQRRRRIFLVADFGGERAREILFERDGLRGYFEAGRTPWEGTATFAENGVGADGEERTVKQYLFENHSQDTRYKGPLDVCPMLPAQLGTGGNNTPFVVEEREPIIIDRAFFNQGENAKYDPQYYTDGICPTLVARGPHACQYKHIVRRLTPTECARLQGFADGWGVPDQKDGFTDEEFQFWLTVRNTHAAINGKAAKDYTKEQMLSWYNKLHTDSSEYKLWGNGVALPCVLYVMQGIAEVFG